MKNFILFIVIFMLSVTMKAHQANASTTMLVEKENGTWVLQISSSLTAFQQEVRTHFSDTPYETPEEFRQMVLQHIKNNLHIIFNDNQEITLSNGIVQLGHETKVVFEVFGIPSGIKSVVVKNTVFEDINRSQSSLILLKEGFKKEHFVLNNTNNHMLALRVDGNEFVEIVENDSSLFSSGLILVFIAVIAALFLVYNSRSVDVTPSVISST